MILSFCALLMAVPAQAQDDFYVDLSALDGLDGGFASDEAELLFPPVAAETKAKEAPKTVAKAASKPQPKPVVAKEAAAKKVVEAPQAKAEVKPDLAKPQTMVINESEKVENPTDEQTLASEPAPAAKQEPLPMPALNNKPVVVEPLVSPAEEDPTGIFAFGEGLYDVTSVMKLQLDELLKKFENPVANKILIVAYNYGKDGGFMSKHIALKRSTGIRSYLLNKGYKNFSIKIINTDSPQQKNLTEVSEIK